MLHTARVPRILADDMEIHAQGEHHARRFYYGYQMTLDYLVDMGAKVAKAKCFLFSTSTTSRIWLSQVKWEGIDDTLAVVLDARDLGAHLNTAALAKAPTLTKRLKQASATVLKIRRLPHTYAQKAHFIRTKALPQGLYGCEASHINQQAMESLTVCIVDTIAPHSSLRAQALVFDTASAGNDLDPQVEVLIRRSLATRRAQVYIEDFQDRFAALVKHYNTKKAWGSKDAFAGPVGYIMQSCQYFNVEIQESRDIVQFIPPRETQHRSQATTTAAHPCFVGPQAGDTTIHPLGIPHRSSEVSRGASPVALLGPSREDRDELSLPTNMQAEVPLPLARLPYQHIRPLLQEVASRQRLRKAQSTRSDIKGLIELDHRVFKDALVDRDPDEARTLLWVANGSGISERKMCSFGYVASSSCPFCGHPDQTFDHIIYQCPEFDGPRRAGPAWLMDFDFDRIPRYLRQGLPPAMTSSITASFWGEEPQDGRMDDFLGQTVHGVDRTSMQANRLLESSLIKNKNFNARQAFQALRGGTPSMDFQDIETVNEDPPDEPNVFNDGSLKVPNNQFWSLGGLGVWWSNRGLQHMPITDNEIAYTHNAKQGEGLAMWASIPGFRYSSTRTEIAAGIVALFANGPVHQASDNMAFVRFANHLLSHGPNSNHIPWQLMSDGDLWEVYHRLLVQKGVRCCEGHLGQSAHYPTRCAIREDYRSQQRR